MDPIMDGGSALGRRALVAVSNMAAIAAAAGPVVEATQEFLGHLHQVFPFDAVLVSARRPDVDALRTITSGGYSDPTSRYLVSQAWHEEAVAPFGLPRSGWPVRERDLPVDPLSLRGVAEYGRADGLHEGVLSALVSSSGAHVGFLMASWTDTAPPPEDVCLAVGLVSRALAGMIDPTRSARMLASALEDDQTVIALMPDGEVLLLRGHPAPELLVSDPPGHSLVDWVTAGPARVPAFLWPKGPRNWYSCRLYRCRDDVLVLAVRPLRNTHELTARELQVLTSLAAGRSNAEAAAELCVTVRTVRAHVEHVLQKLHVGSRTAAVRVAMAEGLLVPYPAVTSPEPRWPPGQDRRFGQLPRRR
jgi:DNA-binding CsgD family transcriptional regulator